MKPRVVKIWYDIQYDGCRVVYSDGSEKQFPHSRQLESLAGMLMAWSTEATRSVEDLEREGLEPIPLEVAA